MRTVLLRYYTNWKYKILLPPCHRFIFFILIVFNIGSVYSGNINKDSLLQSLKSSKKDTGYIKTLVLLSRQYIDVSDYSKTAMFADCCLVLTERLLKQGVNNTDQLLIMKCRASAYINKGIAYRSMGNYPEALNNYYASLKIREQTPGKPGVAKAYNNIGVVLYSQGNYPEALKNYELALSINRQSGDTLGVIRAYINIGIILYEQRNFSGALQKYFTAIEMLKHKADPECLGSSYDNIATVYEAQKNYKMAFDYLFTSLAIRLENGDRMGIETTYLNMGSILLRENKTREAREYINKALVLSKEIGDKVGSKVAFYNLAYLDSAAGNYQSATINYKLFVRYKDSLDNEENTKKSVQARMSYDFEKKEAAVKAEQNKKDAIAGEEKKKQLTIRNSFIAGFALVFLLALLILRGYRNKQMAHRVISGQKEEVEKAKKMIEEQKTLVDEKQKEILDSIRYARRIQQSLLPTEKYIEKNIRKLNNK